jgi:hypothetical protein
MMKDTLFDPTCIEQVKWQVFEKGKKSVKNCSINSISSRFFFLALLILDSMDWFFFTFNENHVPIFVEIIVLKSLIFIKKKSISYLQCFAIIRYVT